MSLKEYVLSKVSPDDYYAKRFPKWTALARPNIVCPFHKDKEPSLNIGLHNGGARCHAASCQKRIGNIVHFEAERYEICESIAARRLYAEFVRPLVNKKILKKYIDALSCDGLKLLKVRKEMGLSGTSIRKFSLGFDTESGRITIPVYDQWGNCVNIRFYSLPSERASKAAKIYNLAGYGKNELFPRNHVREGDIYFMASEKEAMLAQQHGLNAITSTAGEGSWEPDWLATFTGRNVYIVFDTDKGGIVASGKIKRTLATVAKSVKIVMLQWKYDRPDRKDFADWILKEGNVVKDLLKNEKKSRPVTVGPVKHKLPDEAPDEQPEGQPKLPDFASSNLMEIAAISSQSHLLNRRIRTQGIVAAKASNSFSIPWKFKVKTKHKAEFEYELPIGRELLRFVRASDDNILQLLQIQLGALDEAVPIGYLTAIECEIIPIAAVNRDVPYVVQRCFYFGESIKDNVPYYLEIIPTSEIRTQETIGIITKYEPISNSLEKFDLTDNLRQSFLKFQPKENESVWKKLVALADELSANHTHIYNRPDWHIVSLLTWGSPIGWTMPGDSHVERGWINALAIGDTETGKSRVAKVYQSLFNSGVFVNAENCTYVGLVGGAIKVGNGQLMLRWGRIPLCDKQLVVLEELSGLSIEEIANMSEVRSSGIARLDKGGINSQTNSRTRLLCLSNVRSRHLNLSGYLLGVKAIQDLIGHGEDIARFDLITTLVDNEVDVKTINSKHFATIANPIPPESFKSLMHFIWSLHPEQIQFTQKAVNACLLQTQTLATEYHPSIPIFKGGSGRYKLGRIGAAIACIQFSCKGNRIIVTEDHITAAAKLLRSIYDKPSFGYQDYSAQMFERDTVQNTGAAEKQLRALIDPEARKDAIESLIHMTRFTLDQFKATTGLQMYQAEKLLGFFLRSRVIRQSAMGNMWEITLPGKQWMLKLKL